ncbi:MAG TPA: hypothetical protein VLB44_06655 [Kofleriaceae bacterium]|nr:hypothetical protein [Kofleriaceae bacterium]
MRGVSIVIAFVVGMAGVARAEPVVAPPGLTSPVQPEDDVSEIQQIVGPPTAAFFGFGLGHVVEGRWHEKGWIFTLGESLAFAAIVYASANIECTSRCELVGPAMVTGMLGVTGLRIWEVYDTVEGARAKNRRVMQQRMALGLHLAPPRGGGGGGVAGIALSF